MAKPTILELEAILSADPDDCPIAIMPDGSIRDDRRKERKTKILPLSELDRAINY